MVHEGTAFNLHVHVLTADLPEVEELRAFRDRLRADAGLVASYVAAKKAILTGGITNSAEYAIRKGEFVTAALRQIAASDFSFPSS